MKKTRKITLFVLLLALVGLLVTCLCACSDVTSGSNGKDGANGKDGEDGKSAYEIWLDEGHAGTEADFLEWLKGKDGQDGAQGEKGDKGDTGSQGAKGDKGDVGAQGEKGDKGDTGSQGAKGDKGDAGAQGEKGDKGDTGAAGSNGQDGANGQNGLSAYEIFLKYYPYYTGTEEQWIKSLVNGELKVHTITFHSEAAADIIKYVFEGYALTDIPAVPEKEGQTSAVWNITDFSNVTEDLEVTAVYDMRKYVTFHNEFTDDEDIIKVVNYGEAITDIPQITAKVGNESKWSVTNFGEIKTDLFVEAVYQTQGLQYTLINQQTQYRVSRGEMSADTEELYIPAEHEGKPVTVIAERAFAPEYTENYEDFENQRLKFKFVYIPNSIKEIRDYAFEACYDITSIDIRCDIDTRLEGIFGDYSHSLNITKVSIDMSVIPNKFFSGYSDKITDLTLGEHVTEIQEAEIWWWNYPTGRYSPNPLLYAPLEYITVASGNEVFRSEGNCLIDIANKTLLRGTKTSVIPSDGSVTCIAGTAFYERDELEYITIPNTITSIEARAFYGCSALQSITIPNSVTSIGEYVFHGCSSLESAIISNSITSIDEGIFCGCSSLKSVTIPNSVTNIGDSAFSGCNSLRSVTIPNSVTSIGDLAFEGCRGLQSITIPNSVTSIGGTPFVGCNNLESIVIPNSVISIDVNIVYGCQQLKHFCYGGSKAEFDTALLDPDNIWEELFPETAIVYYYHSGTAPTDDGFYWHYDTDGSTPVIWAKEDE